MYRATALLGIARDTGIVSPEELGRMLRIWQDSGETVTFEEWARSGQVIADQKVDALEQAFRQSSFRCMHCMALVHGDQLDGTVYLHCPNCHSAAVKRETGRPPTPQERLSQAVHAKPPKAMRRRADDPKTPEPGTPGRPEASEEPEAPADQTQPGSDRHPEAADRVDDLRTTEPIPPRPDLFRAPPSGLSDLLLPDSAETQRQLYATIESDRMIEARGLGTVEILGRWVITRKVGEGGMATVWQAYNEAIDQHAAVKVLELVEPPELVERFRREARAAGRLDHPNIVRIREVGLCWQKPCIVMEWVEGDSLDVSMRQERLMPVDRVLQIAMQAAMGLQAAHSAGVIHRDVKPGNLLVTHADGRVKITDFGLARVRDAAVRLTRSGTIVGTPLYMAPEQIRDEELSPATDIYALGATIYHLLTGTPPFVGATGASVLHQHIAAPFPLARQRRPDVPGVLDQLLHDMAAKQPRDRPTSMAAVVDQLRQIARELHLQESAASATGVSQVVRELSDTDIVEGPGSTVLVEVPERPDSRFWLQAELLLDQFRRDGARYIVIDLSACESLQSSGIATLLHMREEALRTQIEVMLAAPRDRVRIVIELMGVHNYMPVTQTVQDAIDRTGRMRFRRVRADEISTP